MPSSLSSRIAKGIISGPQRVWRPEAPIRFRAVPPAWDVVKWGVQAAGMSRGCQAQRFGRREKRTQNFVCLYFSSQQNIFFPRCLRYNVPAIAEGTLNSW